MADNADLSMDLDSIENVLKDAKSKGNKKLSVERIYQKKTQLEHILLRPDTYIGSVEPVTQSMWVYDGEETGMVNRDVTFVPGLYKIFDEILVNAADNKQRDKNMDCIKIEIDPEKNKISVWNNGKGIPVVEHKDEKMFVPSLIFGHLLTSSNYNDEERKVTGGRNGYGAKLCNIFSTKFTVETSCKQYNKYFKQTWSDNMGKASEPKVSPVRGEDFTCVTFYPDLSKFKMEKLDKDIVAIMSRRAYDIAGCTRGVKVYLNGKRLAIKGFKDYIDLYVKNKEDDAGDPLKVVHDIINERWEVAVTLSDHGFQQISFVNSIATTKGGSHIAYITDQLASKIAEAVKKKNKNCKDVRPHQIKTHLWVFVNCLIENPTFDSQTKENMTLQVKNFGSKCVLTEKFITLTLKCGVVDAIMSWVHFKAQTELNKKCSGKKHSKLKGIPKLEDANDAGTRNSIDCTLILTEGDSAKSLAVSGLGIVGRDKYGVFPLRGKMLNVREATHKQILENAEINNLIKIMGLQYKKKYETTEDLRTLRYGRLMIMTDQDQDGSHIKGLLINFIHHNWPGLLRLPFLEEFITPIVKARKGKEEKSFFSLPEFVEWKKETPDWPTWKVKYYKGLGTSTSNEAKEYFSDMLRHRVKFQYSGTEDDHAIQLAFSKKMVDMRKEWLSNGMEERKRRRELGLPEIYLYGKNTTHITYNDFVNKELILFSNMDNERSIPSLIDGLKPGQRKVLFTCLKKNYKDEVKVAQLAGAVALNSAYHHGEQSLTGTIINLAQDFVGSNNINLLLPGGQFGTRLQGGKDAASPRYIFTMLSPLTRFIFSILDEPLLRYLYDDNKKIEPEYYVPIIPMLLVNGAEGIGTGWSTKIPNYNPRVIVENLRRMLNGEEPQKMMPWFKNFKGTIEEIDRNHYIVSGELLVNRDENKIEITELPIRVWTQTYKENVLEPMLHGSDKTAAFITDYKEYHTDTTVRFVVSLTPEKMREAESQGFYKAFKLQASLSTSSMVLFDHNCCLHKYETAEDILKEFFEVRSALYERRKGHLIGMLTAEALKLKNQARFILEKIESKIVIENRKKTDMIRTLQDRGYDSDPVKAWKESQKSQIEDDEEHDNSDNEEEEEEKSDSKVVGPDYDYLLGMTLWCLTQEKKDELLKKRDEKQNELEELEKKTPSDLWQDDLDRFMEELDKFEAKEKEDANKPIKQTKGKGPKRKQVKLIDDRLSDSWERIEPCVDVEMKKKAEKKPAGGGEGKRGRKKKDEAKGDNGDVDDPLVPLSERIQNPKKTKETKVKKNTKQTKLTFTSLAGKKKSTSPSKSGKKSKKNPWSDSESGSFSDLSDVELAEDYIPPEKREVSQRRAAAKVKYTFDSGDEESEESEPSMHDNDPEAISPPKSDSETETNVPKPKKPAAKKANATEKLNGETNSPVPVESDDSDMFDKSSEPEKPDDNLFDSLLGDKQSAPTAAKASAPRKAYESDSDSSDGFTVENEKPSAEKKQAAPKKRPRKKKSSSDDDFEPEAKKPTAVKKKTPVKKRAKKADTDKESTAARPGRGRPKKKADSSDDEYGNEFESKTVVAPRQTTGRSRAPVKFNFSDSSDGY